jgi:hypothetical protein
MARVLLCALLFGRNQMLLSDEFQHLLTVDDDEFEHLSAAGHYDL